MPSLKSVLFTHSRILWWVISFVILAFLAGLIRYERKIDSQLTLLNNEHLNLLALGNTEFNRQLGDIRNSTRLLNSHVHDLLIQNKNLQAEKVFLRVGATLDNLSQLRWLDLQGNEVIRINYSGFTAKSVPQKKLQNKAHRPYVNAIRSTLPGSLLLSELSLNRESGQVFLPYQPTIRAMLHVPATHPLGEGFLIVNYRLTELMEYIKDLRSPHAALYMADDTPQWLVYSDPAKEWSGTAGGPPVDIPDTWQQLDKTNAVSIYVARNLEIFSISKLSIQLSERASDIKTLYFIARTPADFYQNLRKEALLPALLTALLILMVGAVVVYRELRASQRIQRLSHRLAAEKQELQAALAIQKKLQNELVEIEKMASLGMLVAGVAHELNTPLGAAIMSISSQQHRLYELKEQLENGLRKSQLDQFIMDNDASLQLALSNLQRASGLIKRFKRLSVDRGSEQLTRFHLRQNVNDIVSAMAPQIKHSLVDIRIDISNSIYLTSYPGILSQVLQNLLNNGLSHAFSAGQHGIITIRAERSPQRVKLMVEDNGNGISSEVADTIFDPFVTSGRGKGNSGLGLHLVYQWVTQILDGHIDVVETSGGGTTFILDLALTASSSNTVNTPVEDDMI